MKRAISALIVLLFIQTALYAAEKNITVTAPAQAEIGQPFLVSARSENSIERVTISWQEKECVLTGDNGIFSVLLGTDLKNARAGTSVLRIICEINGKLSEESREIRLITHKYPRENLKVPPEKLTPPANLRERIKREAELGRAAVHTNTPGSAPLLPLLRPVPGTYSSVYGKSRYFNGQLKGRHGGVDMRAAVGTPVKAAAPGKVVLTGDFWFAGKCVYVDHGAGIISLCCHMSKVSKSKGDKVERGEVIGLSGKSGRVTGPHLHFSVSWRGEFFDPAPLVK